MKLCRLKDNKIVSSRISEVPSQLSRMSCGLLFVEQLFDVLVDDFNQATSDIVNKAASLPLHGCHHYIIIMLCVNMIIWNCHCSRIPYNVNFLLVHSFQIFNKLLNVNEVHLYSAICLASEALFVNHLYSAPSQGCLRQCRLGFEHGTLQLFAIIAVCRNAIHSANLHTAF